MSFPCPNCQIFQVTVFGFLHRRICEYCGYNLEKRGKELSIPTQQQILSTRLNDAVATIENQKARIAELEAEVVMATKLTKGFRQVGIGWEAWNGRDTLVVRYWPNSTKIKQQSATDFEEGEG